MQRIVIAVALSGLLAACGQQSQPVAEGGVAAPLDYIDAVPIDKDAPPPVAQPEPAAKKDEPETEKADEEEKAEPEAAAAAVPTPTPEPAAPANNPSTATRRANEAVAPRSATEVPYSPN